MTDTVPRVMAWVGSLRKESWNRRLLAVATGLAEGRLALEPFDLAPLPFFDPDLESGGAPAAVTRLQTELRAARGLLIVTPEYNFGVPALVKNAIDWASRPTRRSPLVQKPVGLMGASPSAMGTIRAQLQIRQSLVSTDSLVLSQPELFLGRAHEKFDAEGRLKDEASLKALRGFLEAFEGWVRRFP